LQSYFGAFVEGLCLLLPLKRKVIVYSVLI